MRGKWLCGFLLFLASASQSYATPCGPEDFEHAVTGGESKCVVMARFGNVPDPRVLVVWLHGDTSGGGPATSHYRVAEQAAKRFAAEGVLNVGLIRPGYEDEDGRQSDGSNYGRSDNYTKDNMEIVGGAIERLKQHYHPQRVVVVGHSGGAATAANLLGMMPGLVDAALLVSCPCDLVAWRANGRKNPWSRSENPAKWLDSVRPPVRVIALTGEDDPNTGSYFARTYIENLQKRNVQASFELVPGADHNGAFKSPIVLDTLAELIK